MTTKTIKDLTAPELDELLDIHCALSPENLSADGELPQDVVAARYSGLMSRLTTLQRRLGLSDHDVSESAVYGEWEARGRPRTPLLRT